MDMDNISCKCDEAENIRAGSIRFSMTESEKSVDSQARPGSHLFLPTQGAGMGWIW